MACGDVLSLEDLQTAKKHQIFEAEVITGLSGGVAGGASIDYATNQVTGQTQKTLPAVLRDAGFRPASFTFATGGTLAVGDSDVAVLWPVSGGGDGQYYIWKGAYPKVVPASSSPASTGGVSDSAWLPLGDITLRTELSEAAGSTLVGYVGPEGGMVARTVSDKLSDWVDVKDFGAVCDGVTDDTAAIQAAFAHGGVGLPAGAQRYIKIMFPAGAKVKINGTVLVPGRLKVDFNGCRIYGNNSVTMFESAKWVDGALVSNWSDPLGSAAPLFDMQMENAVITDADLVFKWYFMTANCATKNFRLFGCNGGLHAKECFYHTFSDIHAWSPTVRVRPAFFWEGDIQAQGVRKCFASNYPTGHRIQGFNDVDSFDTCGAEVCTTGIYLTGGTGESGGLQNLEFHNWYLEGNATAVLADAAFNYRQINFRNCFWSLNDIHISGETIRSGSIDESNVFNDSVEHPGYFRIGNINNGREGFSVKLPRQWSTTNFTSPTIDTVTKYQVGANVLLERDLTYANPTTSNPVAKTTERYGIVKRDCFGSSVGTVPTGVVPFCDVSLSGLTVSVTSRIQARAHEMVAFSFQAETAGGPLYACGTLINGIVMQPSAGQRPVTISVSAGGYYIFSFSAVSNNPISCAGVVRII